MDGTMREVAAQAAMKVRHAYGITYDLKRPKVMAIDLAIVDAVLDAMREADEAMIEAAVYAQLPGGDIGSDDFTGSIIFAPDVPPIWTAMIDAARTPAKEDWVPEGYVQVKDGGVAG